MKYTLLSSASYNLLMEVLLPALLKERFSVIYNLLSNSKKNYVVFKQKLTIWRHLKILIIFKSFSEKNFFEKGVRFTYLHCYWK